MNKDKIIFIHTIEYGDKNTQEKGDLKHEEDAYNQNRYHLCGNFT